jgi:hypothetical protein
MGQPGIMPDKKVGMSDDARYRDKIDILQHLKWLRTTESKCRQLLNIRWSTDYQGQNPLAAVMFNKVAP